MANKKRELTQVAGFPDGVPPLLETLRNLIIHARQKVFEYGQHGPGRHVLGNWPAHRGIRAGR